MGSDALSAVGARHAQKGNAGLDIPGNELALLSSGDANLAAAVVVALGDGILTVFSADLSADAAVVRHGAGQHGAPSVGCLSRQNFSHGRRGVLRVHIKGTGALNRGAVLSVGGETAEQLVRCDGVARQVDQNLIAVNNFVDRHHYTSFAI